MDEEGEPCAKLCGNCANFVVLDDRPGDPCRWFGVCWQQALDDFHGRAQDMPGVLDWTFDYGRHGDDDCEKPDEWFEEA